MWNPQGSKIKSKKPGKTEKNLCRLRRERGLEIHAMIESKI